MQHGKTYNDAPIESSPANCRVPLVGSLRAERPLRARARQLAAATPARPVYDIGSHPRLCGIRRSLNFTPACQVGQWSLDNGECVRDVAAGLGWGRASCLPAPQTIAPNGLLHYNCILVLTIVIIPWYLVSKYVNIIML